MTSGSAAPVRLRGVCKRYGSTTAVSALDLEVQSAQVLALLGPNGAGKTTTMRIAMGLVRADAGEVRWRGRPLDEEARRRVEETRDRQLEGDRGTPDQLGVQRAARPLDPALEPVQPGRAKEQVPAGDQDGGTRDHHPSCAHA